MNELSIKVFKFADAYSQWKVKKGRGEFKCSMLVPNLILAPKVLINLIFYKLKKALPIIASNLNWLWIENCIMFCLHCIHLTYSSGVPALSVVFSTITESYA